MAKRTPLTDLGIKAAIAEAKKTKKVVTRADGYIPRSHGALEFSVYGGAAPRWSWRYTRPDGTQPRIKIGLYTAESKPEVADAFTLTEARTLVTTKFVPLYQDPATRDVIAHFEREAARAAAEKAAAEAAAAEAIREAQAATDAIERYTLKKLLAAYVAHLEKQGKQSAGDAENIFANHCTKGHPEFAAKPANAITSREIATMLRTLTEAGKGRTAAKLRSYLSAAYALAARAVLDPDAPAAFLPFNVEANPAQATPALSKYSRALERALADPELRAFWKALNGAPDSVARDALLLLLLLGGQRPAQLLRATVADVDTHAKVLRLHDPKGKRAQPRAHALPLTDAAMEVVERCIARAERQKSNWLFSTHGKKHLRPETVTQVSADIAAELLKAPKSERVVKATFQLRDIRRTCETAMARMGISKDVRAQIQSHGLGGIQGRHYDKHTYMPEKTAALTAWAAHLETVPADNVRQLRGGRAS